MSKAEIMLELPSLTSKERREIQAILNDLEPADESWKEALSQEELSIIEARVAKAKKKPQTLRPWEDVKARLKARFGE